MLQFSWEMLFFESGDAEVFKADRNKLFAINKRQIDNHTLMLYMLYSYMSVVCTYHCSGVFKNIFFFYTRQPPGWESRRPQNDVYLALVLTTIIYSSSTLNMYNWLHDVFHPLHPNIRMHILHSVLYTFPNVLAGRICLTITGSSVDYHFLYSRDLDVWLRGDIERRN